MTASHTEQLRERAAASLTRARERSRMLTDAVDDDDLVKQHSRLMSPLVWDLAHVGNQEELWLVRDVGGRDPVRSDIDELYDAFKHPRADRPALPLLGPSEARSYVGEVRDKVLDVLDSVDLTGHEARPLLRDGFAFGMVAQHEQQHDETMLATHQLRTGAPVLEAPEPPRGRAVGPDEVLVPGGPFTMGTSTEPWALDNERPAHVVDVPAYVIDTAPVSNLDYLGFIEAGGYDDPRWWSIAGWDHRQRAGLVAPRFWQRDGDGWVRTRFGVVEPVPAREPVLHVSFYEAEAYAAWRGRRLPTEAEWE
ncbi:MAG: SUMF1/EgtB/PvdO family nonheme iron enzyme, partial [Nocardioidaceae bacterium]